MESSFVALFRAVNTNTSRECLRDTGVIRFHGAPFYAYPTTLSPPPGSILVIKSLVVAIYPPVCPPPSTPLPPHPILPLALIKAPDGPLNHPTQDLIRQISDRRRIKGDIIAPLYPLMKSPAYPWSNSHWSLLFSSVEPRSRVN